MITSALILMGVLVAKTILGIFPNSQGLPTGFDTAITYIGGYSGIWNPILPMDTLAQVVGIIITYQIVIFSFRGIKWLFSHIPFIGGKG